MSSSRFSWRMKTEKQGRTVIQQSERNEEEHREIEREPTRFFFFDWWDVGW